MDSTPCPDIPLPAHITVKDRSGTTVGEATSNDQGEFRLELQAGTYELQAANLSGAPMPSAPSQDVVIKEGSFTEVRVAFDSGVR
ncbi:carboxypeptidase-like regulatory domain-containing protein [Arthrobacter sp. B2I5]|uniref:carboxypeptidase-like regulatory domain-containing protein n=1 Tax=Arthrobacter sp. B2I5 TaxID=3042266 RepID=UPI0027D8F24E|nr:carboxypeptidase-like regulatory domain-containing protein [Arthrobacter sp. B2I5]